MPAQIRTHQIEVIADVEPFQVSWWDSAWEIDRVLVEFDYFTKSNSDPTDPEGWYVTVRVQGWPLTAKGSRNKRSTSRENVNLRSGPDGKTWPVEVHAAAVEAFNLALQSGRIDTNTILGNDGQPGTHLTIL